MAEPCADAADFDRHVRRVDPDRWLSARLIPDEAARTEVLALYALDDELARIAPAVSQPVLGEIRLQWWRDALERAARGGAADHPVIAALAPALSGGRLDPALLERMIGSYEADLAEEPPADQDALTTWMDDRHGAPMALAASLLDPAAPPSASAAAARAWGWSLLTRSRPAGRSPWPEGALGGGPGGEAMVAAHVGSALQAASAQLEALPVAAFPAVAHATLARAYGRGRTPSDLGKRARLLWAAARGAL